MSSQGLSLNTSHDDVQKRSQKTMQELLALPACTLITTGRTGTDLLQSLLDSHPEVLTFNAAFFYHDFWARSKCVAAGKFDLSDFMDEFIGNYIEKFKSRYDIRERKDQMGEDYNESLNIDLVEFKQYVLSFMEGLEPTSRNTLIAIYAAYSVCLGQDLSKKKVFFHHIHHAERLDSYLKDFPESKIICMTRDPRANFVSGVLNWRRYDLEKDRQDHLTYYIRRILYDAQVLTRYSNEHLVVRIEDMGSTEIHHALCAWLGIAYDKCMEESTWGGLLWNADRITTKKKESKGFSANLLVNNWENTLSGLDKYVLNYLMHERLKHYGYPYKKITALDAVAVFFLILLPLKFELHFWSFNYIKASLKRREYKKLMRNVLYFGKRVVYFYQYYFKSIRNRAFTHPYLKMNKE